MKGMLAVFNVTKLLALGFGQVYCSETVSLLLCWNRNYRYYLSPYQNKNNQEKHSRRVITKENKNDRYAL